jgi:hypothetical protein
MNKAFGREKITCRNRKWRMLVTRFCLQYRGLCQGYICFLRYSVFYFEFLHTWNEWVNSRKIFSRKPVSRDTIWKERHSENDTLHSIVAFGKRCKVSITDCLAFKVAKTRITDPPEMHCSQQEIRTEFWSSNFFECRYFEERDGDRERLRGLVENTLFRGYRERVAEARGPRTKRLDLYYRYWTLSLITRNA